MGGYLSVKFSDAVVVVVVVVVVAVVTVFVVGVGRIICQ